jgi:hypothetical protein
LRRLLEEAANALEQQQGDSAKLEVIRAGMKKHGAEHLYFEITGERLE